MKVLFWMFSGFDRHITSEHLLVAIIEQLCKSGNSVHILQKHTGGDLPSIPESLVNYDVSTDAIPFKAANKGNFIGRYLKDLEYVKSCAKYITSQYDAVFIQSNNVAGAAVRAIRRKLPNAIVTFNVQDIFPYNAMYSGSLKKRSLIFKFLADVQRYGYKNADHIITISDDMKGTLVLDGTDKEKIDVIYNWSYQDELYENIDTSPVASMFESKYFNVVYAGNIGVMQNVDILIEAAELMKADKDIWFHIIGNGVYKDKLRNNASVKGITNISFWPMQPPELAPAIYSAADLNVIPLVKNVYRTALPSKTATCLACQRPILFAIGKESVFGKRAKEEAGCLVVETDDPEEPVCAIRKIKSGEYENKTGEFFLNNCMKSKNSMKYAEIITQR